MTFRHMSRVLVPFRAVMGLPSSPQPTYIHPTAIVEAGATIGPGVKIWHFAHVRSGARIGSETQLGHAVYVDAGAVIGARCRVQNFVSVYAGVDLADDVFVGPSAVFTNDLLPRAHNAAWRLVPTKVGRGASIGANATIICGVTIGPWAMIGAGSVVSRDVPAHQLVLGNPARLRGWVCECGQVVPNRPPHGCDHV